MKNAKVFTVGGLAMSLAACAPTIVKRDTISHGLTANAILDEVILDNLEMMHQEPNGLPWHVKLTSGDVSVDDTVNPSFSITWPDISRTVGVSATRDLSFSWTIVPELDADNLLALQDVYLRAINAADFKTSYTVSDHPIEGRPHGFYNGKYISVNKDGMQSFSMLVIGVLRGSPVKDSERALQVRVR